MTFMFEDLTVYKKAMQFVAEIAILNRSISDRIIKDQLGRAALSIPLNIAEGQGRMHGREKRQFYNTARGSLLECVPLIQICKELGYIEAGRYEKLYASAEEISKMIAGLIRAVKVD